MSAAHTIAKGPARTAQKLQRLARAARFLMCASAAAWFLMEFAIAASRIMRTVGPTAGAKTAALGTAAVAAAYHSVATWITFGFIWFFAAWCAKIAEKQAAQ